MIVLKILVDSTKITVKGFLLHKFSGEQPATSLKVSSFTSFPEDVAEIKRLL